MTRKDALVEIAQAQKEHRRADLSGADLSGAHLGGANLSGANKCFTILERKSIWAWAQINAIGIRAVDGRTMLLCERTRKSNIIGNQDYSEKKLYTAPVFSRCSVTDCHPGLYLGNKGTGEIYAALWMDEAILAGNKGIRCERFRTLGDDKNEAIETFLGLTGLEDGDAT